MNRERMLQLAAQIEHPSNANLLKVRFEMAVTISPINRRVGETCATAACAAGFACLLFGEPGRKVTEVYASHLLELDGLQMVRLFYNDGGYISPAEYLADITAQETAAAIRRMVKEAGQ